jgi:hypothetical protein
MAYYPAAVSFDFMSYMKGKHLQGLSLAEQNHAALNFGPVGSS